MADNFSKWQGGPLFYKKRKYGNGANNSGPTGWKKRTTKSRYQGAKLGAIIAALQDAWRSRRGASK